MRTYHVLSVLVLIAICNPIGLGAGAPKRADDALLQRTFDLGGPRSAQVQFYEMETRVITYAPDGKRTNTDVLKLWLKCAPAKVTGKSGAEYTCTKFTVQFGVGREVAVPAMAGWSYIFKNMSAGRDEKGQVFGVDHAQFEKLVDANGQLLPGDKAYFVYNCFIDFHAFCDVFAAPMTGGKGIQDLKSLGQKVVHASAFTEAPVDLGSSIDKGSIFKNGEATLELKGLGLVDGASCALLGFDSGQSSFQMVMKPMPNMEVHSVGASHYKGDIYVDLATKWVRQAVMDELVVTESTVPTLPKPIDTVIERNVTIRNVTPKAAQ
jgi:hypothetical protein